MMVMIIILTTLMIIMLTIMMMTTTIMAVMTLKNLNHMVHFGTKFRFEKTNYIMLLSDPTFFFFFYIYIYTHCLPTENLKAVVTF